MLAAAGAIFYWQTNNGIVRIELQGDKVIAEKKAPATLTPPQYALSFDKNSRVTVSSLIIDLTQPGTLEAYVTQQDLSGQNTNLYTHDGIAIRGENKLWSIMANVDDQPGKAQWIAMPSAIPVGIGKKTHLALAFDGRGQYRLYVDGMLATRKDLSNFAFGSRKRVLEMGYAFTGLMSEVRISKVARYDKDFTPAKRFEPDADTLALHHFDEGQGETLTDSSGNGHHGKIVGAKWVKADGTPIAAPVPVPPTDMNHHLHHLTISPDGKLLAVTQSDGNPSRIWLWKLDGPKPRLLDVVTTPVNGVAFAADSRTLAVAHHGGVTIWDATTSKQKHDLKMPGLVQGVSFASDGRHLITANSNGTAYILRLSAD